MASLTGTVKASTVVFSGATGTNHLQLVIDVDCAGATINPSDATDPLPFVPNNLNGRVITITTNGSNEVTAATGLAIT